MLKHCEKLKYLIVNVLSISRLSETKIRGLIGLAKNQLRVNKSRVMSIKVKYSLIAAVLALVIK